MNLPEKIEILIITLSDRAFSGEYDDLSGPVIRQMLSGYFSSQGWNAVIEQMLIPDDSVILREKLTEAAKKFNIIITTGTI